MEEKNNSRLPMFEADQESQLKIKDDEKQEQEDIVPVKVGVGGLFIVTIRRNGSTKECILLYKRYKDPENNKWSLPGGHVGLFFTCEDALRQKIVKILHNKVDERDIEVLDIVTAVNHFDRTVGYHYVSPQYYININEIAFNKITVIDELKNDTGCIVFLNTKSKLKKSMDERYNNLSSQQTPWLSLVPVDVIKNMEFRELEDIFIHTTIVAVLQHLNLLDNVKRIQEIAKNNTRKIQEFTRESEKEIQATTSAYKKWRSKSK